MHETCWYKVQIHLFAMWPPCMHIDVKLVLVTRYALLPLLCYVALTLYVLLCPYQLTAQVAA